MPGAVATITTKKALSRARALGCDVHIANATGEVVVNHPDPSQHRRVRMNVRRHDASLALRLLLRDIERTQEEPAMPKGQPTSPDTIALIQEMRRAGLPTYNIAERLGVSTKTVGVYSKDVADPNVRHGRVSGPAAIAAYDEAHPTHVIRDATLEERAELQHTVVSHAPVAVMNEPEARPRTEVSDRLVAFKEPTEELRDTEPLDIADVVHAVAQEYKDYPTIRSLVYRQQRMRELMKLAEETHDDDVQLLVMQKMELTGIEKEAVALWEATLGQRTNGSSNGKAH